MKLYVLVSDGVVLDSIILKSVSDILLHHVNGKDKN